MYSIDLIKFNFLRFAFRVSRFCVINGFACVLQFAFKNFFYCVCVSLCVQPWGLFFPTCKLTCTFPCNVSRILHNDRKNLKFCGTLVQCAY